MKTVRVFSGAGDTAVLEYDPAVADMEEVNKTVDNLEEAMHGRAFDLTTGERVERITPETGDVTILRQIAGG